jgi:hypothetical protein
MFEVYIFPGAAKAKLGMNGAPREMFLTSTGGVLSPGI